MLDVLSNTFRLGIRPHIGTIWHQMYPADHIYSLFTHSILYCQYAVYIWPLWNLRTRQVLWQTHS